jgi:hypothetical protein
MMQSTPTSPLPQIVREYTSSRAFQRDAQDLYLCTGYTVGSTTGLVHSGFLGALSFFAYEFGWPSKQHLVITYVPPTLPYHAQTDV